MKLNTVLAIGQTAMFFAILMFLLNYFFINNHLILWGLTGLMFGLSVPFNIRYLMERKMFISKQVPNND